MNFKAVYRVSDMSSIRSFIVKLSSRFLSIILNFDLCKIKKMKQRYTKVQNASSASLSSLSKASRRSAPHRLLFSCGVCWKKKMPYADVLQYSWISKIMKRTHANKVPRDDNNARNSTKSEPRFLCAYITDHSYSFSFNPPWRHFYLHLLYSFWA